MFFRYSPGSLCSARMTFRYAFLLVLLAALGGCASLEPAPTLAMPSSKAPRQPINAQSDGLPGDARAMARVSNEASGRVRRGAMDDASVVQEQGASRFPLTTRYVFGVSNPVVYCAVQHVCDVELQAGEKITLAPRIGDKSRWGVDVVMAGQAPNDTPHLTLMPLEAGIETSLVIVTNKRTYHLFLRATQQQSMLHVAFTYPEDMAARWNALAPVSPSATPSGSK